ncbi:MAG: hypothetical protein ABGX08_17395 [Citromicrobium sp.]
MGKRLKFVGEYTNGRNEITYLGCTFEGHDTREVSAEVFALLGGHPEFEEVKAPRGRPKAKG